jgi:hypothetical protein
VSDGGPLCLVVDIGGPWALRRSGRGAVWATDRSADRVGVPERDVDVLAWRLAAVPGEGGASPVEAPTEVEQWSVRTNGVEGQL